MRLLKKQMRWARWSMPLWLAILLVLATVGVVYAAVTVSPVAKYVKQYQETYVTDTTVTITSEGVYHSAALVASAGTSGSPILWTLATYPTVNTAVLVNEYVIKFVLDESDVNSVSANTTYKVRVINGETGAELGVLWVKQVASPSNAAKEGSNCIVSLSSTTSIPDNISILATKQ